MNTSQQPRSQRTFIFTHLGLALVLGLMIGSAQAQPPGQVPVVASGMPGYCFFLALLGGQPLPPECGGDALEPEEPPIDEAVEHQLTMLRQAVMPFFSYDVAVAAGWDVAISPCVESPAGGMGFHIANLDQLGNGGHLSLLRPEVLLYAPTEDGSMEFLGVEYIIPAPDWPHEEAPHFLGQHLHYNPHQDIWALHVWVGRNNPNGIFEDWNPEVSCEFAH